MIPARGRKRKRSGAFRFPRPTAPPYRCPPPPVLPCPSRSPPTPPPVPMSRPDAPGGPGPGSRYRGGLQHPAGSRQPHPLYRTSSQAYGSRAPTVHEVPTTLHVTSHAFSNTLAQCGMYRNSGLNTYLEKSHVTGPDNFITPYDTLNFHPSYNASRPSYC